jgi:ribosomal protein L16 Arg81 hydroxylase
VLPFEYLLDPITFQDFLASYYEKRPLHIARQQPTYYKDFLTIEDVNDHLGRGNLTHPGIRLIRDGEEIDAKEYTHSVATSNSIADGVADKEKLFTKFFAGYTIVLNSLERHYLGLLRLRYLTESAFTSNAHANIYITPRNAQGFKPHWDNHDVFVLQFEGTKRWRVYDSPKILPSRRHQFVDGEWTAALPSLTTRLLPGDFLYIPRGFVHEAESDDCVSGHITLGLTTYTYADVVQRLIEDIDTAPAFRESLPTNFKEGVNRDDLLRRLRSYLENIDIDAVVARIYAEFASSRMPDATNRLHDYLHIRSLDASTKLSRRSMQRVDVEYAPEVVLRFNNKAIYFPTQARECIEAILESSSFRIDELNDPLDQSSKLLICTKLIEEGLLTIAE